ncbi:MAG: ATP-binding protein, partial [Ignavibacteriae bacterium]|nr:ATP-binding protein [Ignavibacteriota bacterium]
EAEILRQKAEELLKKKPLKSALQLSETDKLRIIHELEVHQIELELQNEKLLLAKEQSEIAREKYAELYDFAPSGYFTLSQEGEIIELNLSGAKILGKERSRLIKSRFGLYVSDDTRRVFNDFLRKVFESNTKESCEVTFSLNGKSHINVHITGIVAENGEQCLLNVVDITERKRSEKSLRESEERYRSLYENSRDAIMILSPDEGFLYGNPATIKLFNCKDEKEFTSTIPAILSSEYQPDGVLSSVKSQEMMCRALENGSNYFEWTHKRINGQEFPAIVLLSRFKMKGILTLQATVRDITGQKQAENELIIAKEHAEESDRLKSAFLANMSHEIRTPMNGILGFADLLKEPNLTGEEQKKYIGIIEKSGVRMLNIINDIIDISKIESGQMEVSISEIDINEKIEYIYTFFKPEAEGKGIQINFKNTLPSKESVIKTDREKIYSILTNLIKNAIKYTNEGSIEFGYTLKRNYIEFYVKDTGIGIPKDRQEAIFERFIQADISDIRALQGAGLGLAIAKAYTEMLGGKIWVESEEGKGSIFYFTIPYNTAELFKKFCGEEDKNEIKNIVLDEGEAKEYFGEIKDLKILIAEDVEPSDMLITIAINKITKEVLHAKTGIEAVEACRNNPDIDVVLMDIKMPEMDGYEATRLIRKFNKNIIIIAQTAQALTGDREKAITAGCNDYISKPIIISKLMAMIKKCV